MKRIILFTFALILVIQGCSKTESDVPENKPDNVKYSVALKADSIIYNNKECNFKVSFSNNPVVASVDFYIDGDLSKTIFEQPYTYTTTLKNLNTGGHTINIIAKLKDGSLLKDEKKVIFQVKTGDEYQGGVIIHTSQDALHGIIAAKKDLEGGVSGKYKYGYYRGGYDSFSKTDGYANTQKFKGKTDSNFAAIACLNYDGGGYNDWYLPSLEESEYLKDFEGTLIPSRLNNIYWTSTLRSDEMHAEIFYFGRVAIVTSDLDIQKSYYVRPFRKF